MKNALLYFALAVLAGQTFPSAAQIKAIWLTHNADDPSSIVVNWQSAEPGASAVYFRNGDGPEVKAVAEPCSDCPEKAVASGNSVLHHVRIPLPDHNTTYRYRVETGKQRSKEYRFKGYPSAHEPLRVAVVGNWGYAGDPDLSHILRDDPHLLVTLGDNVPNLHNLCGEGLSDCIAPYVQLIRSHQDVFATIPFMPVLGNHDKEIRPRGKKYPPIAVYDTTASTFRKFFELPGNEWTWKFTIPQHNVSFVALDINHSGDLGTTWQTSRSYKVNAEQYNWYEKVMKGEEGLTITLLNERNQSMRSLEGGKWRELMERGDATISGYGYFQEQALVDGFPYFTTSLKAGDQYPDPASKFLRGVAGYMLLTFSGDGSYRFEMKTLEGDVVHVYSGQDRKD